MTDYKYDEDEILKEIREYIDSTYSGHYSKNGDDQAIQTAEFIMSHLETMDFFKGNVLKYVTRYGHKDGHNKSDLMKAVHYLLFMLCYHKRKYNTDITKIQEALNVPYTYNLQNVPYVYSPAEFNVTYTQLSDRDFEQLEKAVDNPPEPNENLKDLLKRTPPWDESVVDWTPDVEDDCLRTWGAWAEADHTINRIVKKKRI